MHPKEIKLTPRLVSVTDKMNSLEKKFYNTVVYPGMLSGDFIGWKFNGIRFRLGEGAYYKPDFFIATPTQARIYEVKGHWREAAKVRIKAVAEQFPWFYWLAVQWKHKQWVYEEF